MKEGKMLELNKIYNMDCMKGMKLLDDNSIDLTVTSPPYDNLRTYNGFSWDFEGIAKELYRVTKDGGVVVWIVGDATIKGSETGTSFKQALYFKEIGFNLHDTMIWHKSNPVPQFPTIKRYTNAFDYMFVFTKGSIKTFSPIMENCKTAGAIIDRSTTSEFAMQSADRPRNKKTVVKNKKRLQNVWNIGVGSKNKEHPAIFPEALAQDHILSWSNEGDLVLDPFIGSGTTAKMAKLNNRNYIGFEISKDYCEIAEKRLAEAKAQMTIFEVM
jgi:DNA modification methylase